MSRYGASVIGPFVGLLVVRHLGPESYGVYASAAAVTSLFGALCDFGLQQAALEMAATDRYPVKSIVGGMMRLGCLFTLAAYGAVVVWVVLGGYRATVMWLALLMGLGFPQTPILAAVTVALQLHGRYHRLALWNWVAAAGTWVAAVTAILADGGLYAIVAWPLILGWLLTGVMFLSERRMLGLTSEPSQRDAPIPYKLLFSRSWRFGSAGIMYQAYHRADAALLSLLRDPLEVGQYAVAFRVIELLSAFPSVVFNQVLYPKYFRWFGEARDRVSQYYQLTSKWMLMMGVAVAVVTTSLGRDLILLIFGSAQRLSTSFLTVMVWGIPAYYLAASAGSLLTTGKQIDKKLKVQGLVAVLNVAMNATLIPRHGAAASAVLLVLTDVVLFGLYAVLVKRVHSFVPWLSRSQILAGTLLLGGTLGVALFGTSQQLTARMVLAALAVCLVLAFGWLTMSSTERNELLHLVGLADHKG